VSTSIFLSQPDGTDQLSLHYSLVDKPVSPPLQSPLAIIIEDSEPSPYQNDTNGIDGSPLQSLHIELSNLDVPTVASLLAMLKKSEALEWRASKQFSEYHFSKMTGGAIMSEYILPMSPNNCQSMAALLVLHWTHQPIMSII
ncbi:hypothetical protein V8E55_008653, partial [Tylopilus felleus]